MEPRREEKTLNLSWGFLSVTESELQEWDMSFKQQPRQAVHLQVRFKVLLLLVFWASIVNQAKGLTQKD